MEKLCEHRHATKHQMVVEMSERLELDEDLAAVVVALSEMSERARRTGDRATALLCEDAAEALFPVLDRLAFLDRARAAHADG